MPAESLNDVRRAFTAYTIERELGSGGMATVYLADDRKHDRRVAIKILHAELAALLGAERFLQEIRLAASLQHPHILGLIDSGIIDDSDELKGRPYYVMPFVEGESVRQRLDRENRLPVADGIRIATEVATALDYVHRHGVVHRDIKPENILVHDGEPIIADFGIALAIAQTSGPRLTQTGISLGTPAYMSPEQAAGDREITSRSDIFSLGAVTYEMLVGKPPFTGKTLQEVVAKVITERPRSLDEVDPNIPGHIAVAVARALEKLPADRFSSAREFAEALGNPSGTARRRKRYMKRGYLSAASIAFLGVALITWFALRSDSASKIEINRIAVMPFSVTGAQQIEGLGSGMLELLNTALDGAGDLSTVDQHAVLAILKKEKTDSADPSSARRSASSLGAGTFIVGTVAFLPQRMLINAEIYRVNDDAPLAQIHESGSPDSVTAVVDRVARRIAAAASPAARGDLTELASVTSRSNDALKFYLVGRVRARQGAFQQAVAAFEKSVAFDSAFALGWYALGRAASFTPERDLERHALIRAHDVRSKLPDLDQLRIESAFLYATGRLPESEQTFREILRRHPDDVDASFGLATLLVHGAHRMGRSAAEAQPLLDRVRYYEPQSLEVLNFERAVAADAHDLRRYDSLSRRYVALSPNADFFLAYKAEEAFLERDTASEKTILSQLAGADDFLVGFAVSSVGGYLQDPGSGVSIAEEFLDPRRPRDVQAAGHLIIAELEIAQGHWRNASKHLTEGGRINPESALLDRALIALHPLLRLSPDSLRKIYKELQTMKSATSIAGSWLDRSNMQRGFEPEFRLYLLGSIAARLGFERAATLAAGALDKRGPAEPGRDYAKAAAASVRSQLAMSLGEYQRALQLLDGADVRVWWSLYYLQPFFSQGYERYLRAQALEKLGRIEEAARWYRSNTGALSVGETMYLVPSLIGLRAADMRLGRLGEVASIDARLRQLWQNPDPEFQPQPQRSSN